MRIGAECDHALAQTAMCAPRTPRAGRPYRDEALQDAGYSQDAPSEGPLGGRRNAQHRAATQAHKGRELQRMRHSCTTGREDGVHKSQVALRQALRAYDIGYSETTLAGLWAAARIARQPLTTSRARSWSLRGS